MRFKRYVFCNRRSQSERTRIPTFTTLLLLGTEAAMIKKPIGPPNRIEHEGSTAGAVAIVILMLVGAAVGFYLGG